MSNVVLIVGGTSGIGLDTANYLASDNQYKVVVCGLEIIESENFVSIKTDIRSTASVQALYDEVKSKYGNIYALVHCAGITTKIKPIDQFDDTMWNDIINTNVTGFLRVIKNFHKSLKETMGKVVVVNSIAGKTYSKYSGFEYTASKAALSGIVRQLAMEWSEDGILINSVFPSMTLTPMLSNALSEEEIKSIAEELPLRKLAKPIDIARAIEFLISKENHYTTGSGIDISGGLFLNG
jgi:NAD(P)-dependent dehydrogenase (short-subunit alcohol dehydrogenase family)